MADTARCLGCQARTRLPDLIVHDRCPRCRPAPAPRSVASTVAWLAVLAVLAVWTEARTAPLLAGLLALWASRPVVVLLHQTVRALVARLAGWPVWVIRVGAGDDLRARLIGRTRLVVAGPPWRGVVGIDPRRVPSAVSMAVIEIVPLVLLAGAAALCFRLATPATTEGAILFAVALGATLEILRDLWPRQVSVNGSRVSTAGLRLARLARRPMHERRKATREGLLVRAVEFVARGDPATAESELENAPIDDPGDGAISGVLGWTRFLQGRPVDPERLEDFARWIENHADDEVAQQRLLAEGDLRGADHAAFLHGFLLVRLDRLDEAVALFEERVDRADGGALRALWEACLALALVLRGRGGADPVYAEGCARRAYEALPWVPYVTDAWGMVLVEQGRHGAGLDLFRAAEAAYGDEPSEMRLAWSLVARAARGETERARELRARLGDNDNLWPAASRRIAAVEL